MRYLYGENENFEDYASGRVLYSVPGQTNFPVRLAREIACRCLRYINKEQVCIYDPCCGGGYLLTVLGFSLAGRIGSLIGSDCNGGALRVAEKNVALLSEAGLADRERQLSKLYALYNKDTHRQALASVAALRAKLRDTPLWVTAPDIRLFEMDITRADTLLSTPFTADIVITDVPYGRLTEWSGGTGAETLLTAVKPVLTSSSVVAVSSDKKQKINREGYTRLEKEQIGKRKFELFRLA